MRRYELILILLAVLIASYFAGYNAGKADSMASVYELAADIAEGMQQ